MNKFNRSRAQIRFGFDQRILIVGALRGVWTEFEVALLNEGCNVQVMTYESKDLHETIKQAPPDLVVLEFDSRKAEGFQLAQIIRDRGEIPIVGVSSFADDETILQSIAMFADDFVVKPVYAMELMMRIRRALLSIRQLSVRTAQESSVSIGRSDNLQAVFS